MKDYLTAMCYVRVATVIVNKTAQGSLANFFVRDHSVGGRQAFQQISDVIVEHFAKGCILFYLLFNWPSTDSNDSKKSVSYIVEFPSPRVDREMLLIIIYVPTQNMNLRREKSDDGFFRRPQKC